MATTLKAIDNLPTQSWIDQQWISHYNILRGEFGKPNANELFLAAWQARKNEGLLGSTADTSNLRTFLKGVGINIGADGIFAYVEDATDFVTGTIESVFSGVSKYFVIVGIVAVIIIFMVVWGFAKNEGAVVGGAAKVALA